MTLYKKSIYKKKMAPIQQITVSKKDNDDNITYINSLGSNFFFFDKKIKKKSLFFH